MFDLFLLNNETTWEKKLNGLSDWDINNVGMDRDELKILLKKLSDLKVI